MSTREEDSSPSRPLVSARPTQRDVPIAKYKEVGVGTSPPRGLRGQSLQPGQGAPERINPEEIELAVLREADTLDAVHLTRADLRRASSPELSSSPAPTPVSVEVPRIRSVPPPLEPVAPTPLTPSARSVQSGTLMSIGSIDPRAPTELSLPSPRALSHSERAAYVGPGAVVDRLSAAKQAAAQRDLARFSQRADAALRAPAPRSEPLPQSSARKPPASSARPSAKADSPAPMARNFARPVDSYSPVDRSEPAGAPESNDPRSARASQRQSELPVTAGARFEIHSDLASLPREFLDDNFDLRSVATQREPLASRKPMPSTDWTPTHEPVPSRRDSAIPSERPSHHHPSSSSAITIMVDRTRESLPDARDSRPSFLPEPPRRIGVPLSWVLGSAAFAILLALGVAWIMRQPAPEAAHTPSAVERATALGTAQPSLQAAVPASTATIAAPAPAPAPAPTLATQAAASPLATVAPALKPTLPPALRTAEAPAPSAARPAAVASAHAPDLHATPAPKPEVSPKTRQSIY